MKVDSVFISGLKLLRLPSKQASPVQRLSPAFPLQMWYVVRQLDVLCHNGLQAASEPYLVARRMWKILCVSYVLSEL